jgi:hypothetical protein
VYAPGILSDVYSTFSIHSVSSESVGRVLSILSSIEDKLELITQRGYVYSFRFYQRHVDSQEQRSMW